MYILQGFLDVLGDRHGRGDTGISLEVLGCLQHLPVVVLTQGGELGRGEGLALASTGEGSTPNPYPYLSRPG